MDQSRVPGLRVSVLRGVDARRDGLPVEIPGRRLRSLLALLALTPGTPRRAGYLADQLWAGDPPSANALQALVSRLRRALGSDAVVSRPAGYVLAVAPEQVDLIRFDRLVSEGTPAAAREALGLAGPEPLAEFAEVPDLADEARRVEAACWRVRRLADSAPVKPPDYGAAGGAAKLVGRDRMLAEITEQLATTRLLNLVGVGVGGGGGSSGANGVSSTYAGGPTAAELRAMDFETVAAEFWTALGGRESVLPERTGQGAEQRYDPGGLPAALADRSLLLVLDGCAHVVDVADLAALILDRCPEVTILTAARGLPAAPGEVRLRLDPLPVRHAKADRPGLDGYSAAQPLIERGRAGHVSRAGGVPGNGRQADDRVRRMRKALGRRASVAAIDRGDPFGGQAPRAPRPVG
jgi:hypothetical protein